MFLGNIKEVNAFVLHEAKAEDEQTTSYICIRAMLTHTKKSFIPFLEMQNKAVSLRQGNKTICHNCYPLPLSISILSCYILLYHCTTVKEIHISFLR